MSTANITDAETTKFVAHGYGIQSQLSLYDRGIFVN